MSQVHFSEDFRQRYGPWAVVAGASRGLGAEYARQLAEKGLDLVLVARDEHALQSLADQLSQAYPIQIKVIALDLSADDSPAQIMARAAGLEIGLLVYNAAYSAIGLFHEISLEDHLREFSTNQRTPLILAYEIGKQMVGRGRGGIILMSSLSGAQGSAFISNYAATKAYNQVLAEGLWEELRVQGIDVLAVCPSAVSTPNYLGSLEKQSKKAPVAAMPPRAVVTEALAALGKRPLIIPGRTNRLAAFFMQRLLPRPTAIRLMGRVLRDMYS